MSAERHGGLRARIAGEAARLMYDEGVKQYFTAKRLAAKRLLGRTGGRRLRYRPQDLPSNGEIRDALLAIAELAEGPARERRLFAMRVVALETMESLAGYEPRLIGSVGSGHIRAGSDIDLHVFTDDESALEAHVRALRWTFETEHVTILKFGEVREYTHLHVADVFPIELTVYAPRELRMRPRSSTDGKPIERIKPAALRALLEREHTEPWQRYVRDGVISGLDEVLASDGEDSDDAGKIAGPYDGLLMDDPVAPELLVAEPGEGEDADGEYDPLPGFEGV